MRQLCTLALACATGCASQGEYSPAFRPVAFEGAGWRAIVEGGVENAPTSRPARRRLEDFLYGPEDSTTTVLRNPQGITGYDGRLFVCDQGIPGVVELGVADTTPRLWTANRTAPACPVDVAFDEAGRAYVADTTLRSILIFDDNGRRIAELRPPNAESTAFRPAAVLWHSGVVYVANPAGRRIERFEVAQQNWLEPFTSGGATDSLGVPTGLAMTADGELLVADALLGVVHRLSTEGRHLEPISGRGRGPGELVRPADVATTADGLVLVTDSARQSLLVFSETGGFIMEIGALDGWRGFVLPNGVAVFNPPKETSETTAPSAEPDVTHVVVSDTLGRIPLLRITLRPVGKRAPTGD